MHDGGAPVQMHELQMRPRGAAALATGMPDEWLLMYQVPQLLYLDPRSPEHDRATLHAGTVNTSLDVCRKDTYERHYLAYGNLCVARARFALRVGVRVGAGLLFGSHCC